MPELLTLGSVIKTAYEGTADTNAFTDAEKTKVGYLTVTGAIDLDGIVSNATHTGDATGDTALSVVALRGVSLNSTVGAPSDGDVLVYRDAGADWVLEAKPDVAGIPAGGSNGQVLKKQSGTDYDVVWGDDATGGGGIGDGDKGDITVSGGGSVWTIDNGVVSNAKLATMATQTFKGRSTAGTGAVEDLSPTTVRTILNVANGAQVNPTGAEIVSAIDTELGGSTWQSGGGAAGTSYYNGTGSALAKGAPVCLAAYDAGSGNPGMAAADADGAGLMPCIGILGAEVANAASGTPVLTGGEITGLDTSAWAVGETLYVSATTGALTNTRPATGYVQPVAIVSRVDAVTGEIIVAIGAVGQIITALTLATSIDGTERFPISGDKALTTGQMIEKSRAVDYIAETTTARTLSSTDNGKVIGAQNAGATVITIPANGTVSLPVGFTVHFTADTDATVTIDAETGVSLNGVAGGSTTISTKYRGVVTAHKTATDTWFIRGDCAVVA